ncbi:DUF3108 domain-containing protein [Lampropedia aestuarii]|uniref:DUF3108 domain-containing protein n=2 Tax=Lampropedia aestuarii TaxID=2562762 RepID=A0A4S5BJX3_9BURK|nr:DUF3108 domain-containing protein [Lampropedia aestuarii]
MAALLYCTLTTMIQQTAPKLPATMNTEPAAKPWACYAASVLALAMASATPAWSQESVAAPAIAGAQTRLDQPFTAPPSAELDFEVTGKVSGFGYKAKAKLDWQHNGSTYQAQQSIRAPIIGTRSQQSEGQIAQHYLEPLSFKDSSRSKRNLTFDPANSTVFIPATKETRPSPAGAQDRLSVFFQLAGLVAANPSLREKGQTIPIWTVANNKQASWEFEVESVESIGLPVGELPAIKLKRIPKKEDDQIAEIWLSSEVGYLPVRIHFEDDGDAVDLQMTQYRFKEATTTPPSAPQP